MVVLFAQQQPAQSYYGMPALPTERGPPPGLPPNYMPSIPAQGATMQSFQRAPPQPPSGMPPPMMNANFAQPPPSVGSIQHVATTGFYKQHKHVQCGPTVFATAATRSNDTTTVDPKLQRQRYPRMQFHKY